MKMQTRKHHSSLRHGSNLDDVNVFSFDGLIFKRKEDKWVVLSRTTEKIGVMSGLDISNLSEVLSILRPKYGNLPPLFERLTLFVNNGCNLKCVYCYAGRKGTPKSMSFEVAKISIDFYLRQRLKKQRILFHGGGEPTLEIEFIKRCVSYIEKNSYSQSKTSFSIFTNGVMSEKTLKWLCDKGFDFSVSVDGCPSVQDNQRPLADGKPSSPLTKKTLFFLSTHKANYRVVSTFTNPNLSQMVNSVRYFESLGVKSLWIQPAVICGVSIKNKLEPINIEEFIKNFRKVIEYVKYTKSIKLRTPGYSDPFPHLCYTGASRSLSISYGGFVTGCTVVLDRKHPLSSEFIIGEIDTTTRKIILNWDIINKHRKRSYIDIPECRNCYLQEYCNGGCMMRCLLSNGKIDAPDPNECEFRRQIYLLCIDEFYSGTLLENCQVQKSKNYNLGSGNCIIVRDITSSVFDL